MDIACAYPVIKETVPASRLGYQANNVYPGYPPMMSDGRSITTTWQPEAVVNEQLIADNGIQSNWQYRKYLQDNALQVMQQNMRDASNDCGFYDRYADYKFNNGTPVVYQNVMDNRRPQFYADSDLKQMYLSREQLEALKMAPVIRMTK